MTSGLFALAWSRVRARRGRAVLAVLGIGAVGVMVGASVTVSYSLATGFDRAAGRAQLPDVIASFDAAPLGLVRDRAGSLPNVESLSYRLVQSGVPVRNLSAGDGVGVSSEFNAHAVVEGVLPGRRGYTIVAGHDLTRRPLQAVIERGLAQTWHIGLGDLIDVRGFGHFRGRDAFRVVGIAVAPDNVAFPLAAGPRVYVPYADARRLYFPHGRAPVNQVLLWSQNADHLPVTLEQARLATFGITGFQFVTRAGVRVLIDGAAGIVIGLLVAFSVIALASAAVMLAAASYADVQRHQESLATMRALGASRLQIVEAAVLESLVVAVPAAAAGVGVGWALAVGPTTGLLDALNEFGAGFDMLWVLALGVVTVSGTVAAAAAWPAWQVTAQRPAQMLRGAELRPARHWRWLPGGALGLGVRMTAARPLRALATVMVVAASAAVILLMLSLASVLDGLQHHPGTVGKRYALTVSAPPGEVSQIRAIPGVAHAAARYVTDAVDSFSLGESFQIVAYSENPSQYENPPLVAGRRVHGPAEADIGVGLASALNLRDGSTLAAELPNGSEVRFRVVGIVAALQNDGRITYVESPRLVAADPSLPSTIAVDLQPGAHYSTVKARAAPVGRASPPTGGVTSHSAGFLAVLATLLRTVSAIDGLVCLYAVVQMLSLTAFERRTAVATLRACGARPAQLAAVFLGSAAVVAVAALPLAAGVERWMLGPNTASLATSYAVISLTADPTAVVIVALGLAAAAAAAAGYVTWAALRASTADGLRGK